MTTAIIVAAGRGTRMGPNVDKIFLEVGGAPVVAHTWHQFDGAGFDEILLVIRTGLEAAFGSIAASLPLKTPWRTVEGGRERQDSVWNGLCAAHPATEWVAIHDGARPCTSIDLIHQCLAAARRTGASVAGQPAVDTMKESADGHLISRHLDRSKLWAVQTPQCFRLKTIRQALDLVRKEQRQVTDDTAACELIGQPVELVLSSHPNPKVTAPTDLPWIEYLLRAGVSPTPGLGAGMKTPGKA